MKINKEKFRKEIFEETFNGNYTHCAEELGISTQHLHKYLTTEGEAGPNLLGGLAVYCKKNKINFWSLIFLPDNSTIVELEHEKANQETSAASKLSKTG